MKSGRESRYLKPEESFLCAGALPLLTARLWGGGASVIKAAQVILFSLKLSFSLHSCWLSVESGAIWAFVGPALLVIVVSPPTSGKSGVGPF